MAEIGLLKKLIAILHHLKTKHMTQMGQNLQLFFILHKNILY